MELAQNIEGNSGLPWKLGETIVSGQVKV